jgi:hypothetical protein
MNPSPDCSWETTPSMSLPSTKMPSEIPALDTICERVTDYKFDQAKVLARQAGLAFLFKPHEG